MSESRKFKAAWPAAFVALGAVVAFLPALLGRTVVDEPETLDIANQWLGFANFVKTTYLSGRFPLWDPHDMCGMPFLAFAHTSSLYPPHVIAHVLLPSYTSAHAALVFLHLALAGCGAFLLLGRFTRSDAAAGAGAIAYAFAGFIFGNINFPPTLYTGAWLPWLFFSALELRSKPRASMFLLLAVSFAAMIAGGDLEMCIFGLLVLAYEMTVGGEKKGVRGLGAPASALALGGLIALPLILPALELQHHSIRAAMDFFPRLSLLPMLAILPLSIFPRPLPPALYPANHGLDPYYVSAVLVLFAIVSLRGPEKKRLGVFLGALVYLVLFYASPFNILFHRFPLLGGIVAPLRVWPPLTIILFIAAARAIGRWIEEDDSAKPFSLPGGKAGAAFLMVLGFTRFHAVTFDASTWIKAAHLAAGAALITAGVMAFTGKRVFPRKRILLALIIIDLLVLSLASIPMTDKKLLEVDPRVKQFLENTSGKSRYAILAIRGIIDPVLPYHLGLRVNADTIDAFIRTPPAISAERLADIYPRIFQKDSEGRLTRFDQMSLRNPQSIDRDHLADFSKNNVEWFLSRFPAPDLGPDLPLLEVKSWPDLYIYRNPKVKPRAVISDRMSRSSQDSRFFPEKIDFRGPDDFTVIHIPGLGSFLELTISGSRYPGWAAMQGKTELKLKYTDLMIAELRPLAQGPIRFRFVPASFRVGLWAGIASLFASALFALAFIPRRASL